MNTFYKIIYIVTCILLVIACKEEVTNLYEDNDALYFFNKLDYTNKLLQKDSLNYSFFFKEDDRTRDTVEIILCTMGFLHDYDREFELYQKNTSEQDAAIPGKHYISFDSEEGKSLLIIPANQSLVKIPVIILREGDMRTQEFRLDIGIKENKYFRIGIEDQSSLLLKISDMATKPGNWDRSWRSYFGEWGGEKMKFIINYVGIDDFEDTSRYDYSYLASLRITANEKLEKHNKERAENNLPPLAEADGTIVEFPK